MATICVRCAASLPDIAQARRCRGCGADYPLLDGVEVLAPDYRGHREESWDPELFEALDDLLDGHPWYVGRNRAILAFLRRYTPDVFTGRGLDLGCGNGFVTAWLAQNGLDVQGADIYLEGLRLARRRTDARLALVSPGRLPYVDEFDLVVLADVIEHVEDDVALLAQARAALHGGGAILVTVPAFSWLWGRIDDAAHHRRRYSAGQLRRTLEAAGFSVLAISYYMMPLVPVIFARRLLHEGSSADTFVRCSTPPGRLTSAVLSLYLRLEERLITRGLMPVGSSLLAVARAPSPVDPELRRSEERAFAATPRPD